MQKSYSVVALAVIVVIIGVIVSPTKSDDSQCSCGSYCNAQGYTDCCDVSTCYKNTVWVSWSCCGYASCCYKLGGLSIFLIVLACVSIASCIGCCVYRCFRSPTVLYVPQPTVVAYAAPYGQPQYGLPQGYAQQPQGYAQPYSGQPVYQPQPQYSGETSTTPYARI